MHCFFLKVLCIVFILNVILFSVWKIALNRQNEGILKRQNQQKTFQPQKHLLQTQQVPLKRKNQFLKVQKEKPVKAL